MKKSFAQILEGIDSRSTAKMASKLPSWHAAGCIVPSSLALEQCSSEAAALYKAGLAEPGGGCIADLTGGLGVDCHAFAQRFRRVLYFERNQVLADEARRNFTRLGASNIEVSCLETGKEFLKSGALGRVDWIYMDPARRDAAGRKVFLLEDCSPNVLELLPLLWEHCGHILLKLSPMADISMIRNRLGSCLREIHVVGLGGEVKELLCVLEKDNAEPFRCFMAQIDGESPLVCEAIDSPDASFADPAPGMTLLEPGALLLKAGIRNIPGLSKPAPFTNLFISWLNTSGEQTAPSAINSANAPGGVCPPDANTTERQTPDTETHPGAFAPYSADGGVSVSGASTSEEEADRGTFPGAFAPCSASGGQTHPGAFAPYSADGWVCPSDARHDTKYKAYCKIFRISEVLPLNRAGMKEAGTKYPKAEVSARNIPMTSDELRKRLGCKSGGDIHIFGISSRTEKLLLICERLQKNLD